MDGGTDGPFNSESVRPVDGDSSPPLHPYK
jgi:hypothetical protein